MLHFMFRCCHLRIEICLSMTWDFKRLRAWTVNLHHHFNATVLKLISSCLQIQCTMNRPHRWGTWWDLFEVSMAMGPRIQIAKGEESCLFTYVLAVKMHLCFWCAVQEQRWRAATKSDTWLYFTWPYGIKRSVKPHISAENAVYGWCSYPIHNAGKSNWKAVKPTNPDTVWQARFHRNGSGIEFAL